MKREIFSESFHFHIDVSWNSSTGFIGQPFLMDVSSIVKSPWICLFEDISFRSTWRSLYKERAVVPDNVSSRQHWFLAMRDQGMGKDNDARRGDGKGGSIYILLGLFGVTVRQMLVSCIHLPTSWRSSSHVASIQARSFSGLKGAETTVGTISERSVYIQMSRGCFAEFNISRQNMKKELYFLKNLS